LDTAYSFSHRRSHLDARGRELPTRNEDWIIYNVTDTEVRLDEATILPLTTTLGVTSRDK
jgi:hypothetical protein